MKSIVNVSVENIYPHPDNPRKDLGDLNEMVKSIEKNGIMQNLTIIPVSALSEEPEDQPTAGKIDTKSDFHVLIGHRRLAAAKKAGLTEVPCQIVSQISKKEQLSIMLEENMQRNDLTIYEQAQGFQMMLDLGDTVEDIVEKTGFSQATVYHRLNIAKLNQKELLKKEQDENFQLSLKDLIELEKIKNIKTRNKVLKEARDSANLAYLAKNAATQEKRSENTKLVLKKLEDRDIEQLPDGKYWWDSNYERIKDIDLDKDIPEKIKIGKNIGKLYYREYNGTLYILKQKEKSKEEKSGLSDEEKQKRRNKKILNQIQKALYDKIDKFLEDILNKETDWINEKEFLQDIWEFLIKKDVDIDFKDLVTWNKDRSWWSLSSEEKQAEELKLKEYPMAYQMLIAAYLESFYDVFGYDLNYKKEDAKLVIMLVNILEKFGFSINEEEQQLIEGTHEAYKENIR